MDGHRVAATEVKPNRRYWLRADGAAFEVDDHLRFAQYAKAESDEYERPMPWGYEDMFRHGWIRIHAEAIRFWADPAPGCEPTPEQQQWIKAACDCIAGQTGTTLQVGSAVQEHEKVLSCTDATISATQKFIRKIGLG